MLAQDHELITRSLQAMQPWIAAGKLQPEVGHTLPMEQAGGAHRLVLQRANYFQYDSLEARNALILVAL